MKRFACCFCRWVGMSPFFVGVDLVDNPLVSLRLICVMFIITFKNTFVSSIFIPQFDQFLQPSHPKYGAYNQRGVFVVAGQI